MTCGCIWHSIGRSCERCSVAGILVLTRALLHPDHVTQRSCASAVSLLFSALDRPMEPQMSIQVVNICDLFFYEHCSLLCAKVCEACCLTVAAFAGHPPLPLLFPVPCNWLSRSLEPEWHVLQSSGLL